jgi:hypothetical protein
MAEQAGACGRQAWRTLQLAGIRSSKDQTPQAEACATQTYGTNRATFCFP